MVGEFPIDWQKTHPPLELLRRKLDGKILPLIGRVPHDENEYVCTVEYFLYWTSDGQGEMRPHAQWHPVERYEQSGYCGIENERRLE